MSNPLRFVFAIGLMFLVLVGTNVLFPPIVPEPTILPDSVAAPGAVAPASSPEVAPAIAAPAPVPQLSATPEVPAERSVTVESPSYRFEFSTYGARMVSAELPLFQSLRHDGVVDLVPAGSDGFFGQRVVAGNDTIDLGRVPYRVEPENGLRLTAGGNAETLRFMYERPEGGLRLEMTYTFEPDGYAFRVEGQLAGVDRPLLLTDLGDGLAFAEADSASEARLMAFAYNHLDRGITSQTTLRAVPGVIEGPLLWAAFRSKFFVTVMLAGASDETTTGTDYLGGLIVGPSPLSERVAIEAAQSIGNDGRFTYRLFVGPQEYGTLSSLGQDLEEVNPYGWRFFRPIIRPFVSIIIAILNFLHTNLSVSYGWVLVVFGVAMRIVLFPLNHKAMKSQMKNMEFQPRLAEAQKKYKDNPEKMQQEVKRLYAEGFNPLAGCLPLLLPWPVLIALFFVFQNTIEFRGVPFLWLPDLSTKDPFYVLPMLLAASMFVMQWMSLKSVEQPNPQMKIMMWMMPPMMLLIFLNLASGLNLYYVVSNLMTIPQQMLIARERKKLKARPAQSAKGG
ncbi:MAG: membrane protein insertase YidC [Longimicrobiales bacterium]